MISLAKVLRTRLGILGMEHTDSTGVTDHEATLSRIRIFHTSESSLSPASSQDVGGTTESIGSDERSSSIDTSEGIERTAISLITL